MDRLYANLSKYIAQFSLLKVLFSLLILFSVQAKAETPFLIPDEAFVLKASSSDPNTLNIHFDISKGYFLYHKHFKFMTIDGKRLADNTISFPNPIEKISGKSTHSVFANQLDLKISMDKNNQNLKGIVIGYQGCSENGFCYNPIAKKITLDKTGTIRIEEIPFENLTKIALNTTKEITHISETDQFTDKLKNGSLFTILSFFGIGILLAFTPCVLPMVPILANILVGEDKPLTSGRSMFLASVYILSMATCYALAGVTAALIGTEMQHSLQSPIFLVALSFILMLFALSQFNFIYIQLPPFFNKAFSKLNIQHKQGSAIGACTMGIVSALMGSPCVTPALIGALTFIAQSGNVFLGGMALFALALGMGTPMLIIAILGSHLLPKAGAWMTQVKNVTGILLMVLAASILLRAFPSENVAKPDSGPQVFARVNNPSELKVALELAKKEKQAVILDVYADWCVSCKQIDQDIFSNQNILTSLQNTKLLRFDMTQQGADQEKLKRELGIIGPPTVLFFNSNGEEAKAFRLVGKIESGAFISHFNSFLNIVPE